MKFQYPGSKQDLLNALKREVESSERGYRLEFDGDGRLSIGFQRLSHSGGRWFVADISTEDNKTELVGNFQDILPSAQSERTIMDKAKNLLAWLIVYGIMYLLLYVVFLLVWKLARMEWSYIPIFLPIIPLLFLQIGKKRNSVEPDRKFITFMTQDLGCEYIP